VTTVAILGVGAMGGALAAGLVTSGHDPGDLVAIEQAGVDVQHLRDAGYRVSTSVLDAVEADYIIVATKPHHALEVVQPLGGSGFSGTLVSIAAGITTRAYEDVLGDVPVVRAMPNTPALVGEGMTGVARGSNVTDQQMSGAVSLLESVGQVVVVEEADLDAVTAVSGSGPAYVFLLAEALIDAAIAEGLAPDVASQLATATVRGAGILLSVDGAGPAGLRARVTSPGGTTEAAVAVFEEHGWAEIVARAVTAAADRSRTLREEKA